MVKRKECKICGEPYIMIGLDIFERCIKCIDELEEDG